MMKSRFFIALSGIAGLAVLALPLYLYPIATFDPIEGGAFYQSPSYLWLFVPYAAVFALSSIGILMGRCQKIFSLILFLSFFMSHFHIKKAFGELVVFKPAFVVVCVLLPAAIFALGTLTAWKKR